MTADMERSTNEFEYFGDDDDWFYSSFRLFDHFTDNSQLPSPNSSTPRVRPTANASLAVIIRGVLNSKCLVNLRLNKIWFP